MMGFSFITYTVSCNVCGMDSGGGGGAIIFLKCTFLSNSICTKCDQVNGATFCIIHRTGQP